MRHYLAHSFAALAGYLALFALVTTPCSVLGDAAGTHQEYQIKAAVLYKAAKFVTWPEGSFQPREQRFVVCVVGPEYVLRAFASIEKRPLQGRALTVRRVGGDILDLRRCDAAFFAQESGQDVDYALRGLADSPILTVGETEDFTRRGGILSLITRDDKTQFTIGLAASKRAGLTISSQLLHLATVESNAE
jgi:hypothetical protein